MSQIFNVALASYGMSGQVFHAPLIAACPHLKLASVVQRSGKSAQEQYPDVHVVTDLQQVLNDPTIHIVVVNTPNALHYPMARDALRAGKHVVLEKPFSCTLDEGRKLIALAEQQGLMLTVFHNRRLQSGYLTAQKLLHDKTLGKLNTFATSIDRFRPAPGAKKWKEEPGPGAGLLYDLGSHLIDECLMLFGLPSSVYADLRIERDGARSCDYFDIRLDYPSHKCVLKASMLAREPAPAYVMHGDQGSYIKTVADVQESRLAAGTIPAHNDWAAEEPHQWGFIHLEQGRTSYPTVSGNYSYFYDNVYRHLTIGEALLVQPEQALVVVGMIDVLERSARERACIELA
ncbi:Gfo/Idh/MocA family oxidoreductase [Gilvimarinus polysaccharolyticus]|uniref:Gfo/Idh/MocA family oxidoreductase n=1 Tax=Gilvimarinus polysaccharolyticus TaxID=863921 RepID=UPI0006738D33|nr:Gfo/Idh/MocA family oxidoreductase [Gilvimarinus polysaccharolyticus]